MPEMLYARDVYGKTLVELGKTNKDIVVLDADLSGSTRTSLFKKEFPERFFNFGVAEQNMIATAAGLASCGKVVFASTFAMFATGRCWDQFRNSVCYSNLNVKLVATHAGITVGPDGASHQALEDVAIMRAIPNVRIIVPCDGPETRDAITTASKTEGPFYIRLGRAKVPTIEGKEDFKIGKGYILGEGTDVSLVACGIMLEQAIKAREILSKKKISAQVINMHSIKPLDEALLLKIAKKTKRLVVCEEHSVIGGLASAISEFLSETCPTKISRVGVKNRYGQSGDEKDLLAEYKLTCDDIVAAAEEVVK